MNCMRAAKGNLSRTGELNAIHSAAEILLGRRLTVEEVSLLSKKSSLDKGYTNVEKYGFGAIKCLLQLSRKSELICSFSPNASQREGNCLIHAIYDSIFNNEAFEHTGDDNVLRRWTELLKDFKFYEDMDDADHINYLRSKFVLGASEWLAGMHGSKENEKSNLGYSDVEWEFIWSTMIEEGAWAVPSLQDHQGNIVKENNAPEMFIKFAAHELKCNIIVFDLQFGTVRYLSGNHLISNNVIFDSPLLLYSTGSHFQAVFQIEHEFFIEYANNFEVEILVPIVTNLETIGNDETNLKKINKRKPIVNKSKTTKKVKRPEENSSVLADKEASQDICLKRLEELKNMKARGRTDDQKKELEKLKKQVARRNKSQASINVKQEKDRLRKN